MRGSNARAVILHRLRDTEGFTSGQALARELGISRPGVWKHIEAMRAEGYEIEAVPRLGYRLVSSPDVLSAEEILPLIRTKAIGRRILHFDNVTSTNDVARDLAVKGEREGTVVIAETQGQGRGRLGRAWISPPGGVYFSVILRPVLPPGRLANVTLMTAVATAAAIREATGVDVSIKWPNDVMADGRKIVGILTEMLGEADAVNFVIVGIGINANTDPRQYPQSVRSTLTSLSAVLGEPVDRLALAAAVLQHFDEDWTRLGRGQFADVLQDWRRLSSTLGAPVRVSTVRGVFEGTALDIGPDGELIVAMSDGRKCTFTSGEVEHLRSA